MTGALDSAVPSTAPRPVGVQASGGPTDFIPWLRPRFPAPLARIARARTTSVLIRRRVASSRTHLGLGAAVHLLFGDVLDVRRDRPDVTEGIDQHPRPIAVELVGHGPRDLPAGGDRPREPAV